MSSLFLANITSPPLLFFFLGLFAALVRSDLQVPAQAAKLLSIYLLLAIGFKGGVALSTSNLDAKIIIDLAAATVLATLIPIILFFFIKRLFTSADAAALAATYGSISAVTFVTCTSYLNLLEIDWGGHMVAAMALMEAPAIIVGLLLYRVYSREEASEPNATREQFDVRGLLHESMLNGSVLLILGSLAIGWISGEQGMAKLNPFVNELFLGMLCLFLLDMGIVAARRIIDTKALSQSLGKAGLGQQLAAKMIVSAVLMMSFGAAFAALFAWGLGMSEGDALLLVVLGASASYIAVPAAMRLALPEANPSIYLTMSMAITFPVNLLIGIPLYHQIVRLFAQ